MHSSPEKTKYYSQLATALVVPEERLPTLMDLAKDPRVPAMFRASAIAELVMDDSPESLQTALDSLDDPSGDINPNN